MIKYSLAIVYHSLNEDYMCPSKSLACLLAVFISSVSICPAATFYIDSQEGLDANPGTTKSLPWKTLSRVNREIFAPGDKVLFRAGTRYRGQLKPNGSGAMISDIPFPIKFDMYGQGPRPRIDAEGQYLYAVYLYNVQYIELKNLEITNKGPKDRPNRCGVYIHIKDFGTAKHIHLKKLFIHDVNGSLVKKQGGGRAIKYRNEGQEIRSRFDGLLIEDCHLKRCQRNGINGAGYTRRDNWYPNLNVVIRRNLLEEIPGDGIVPIACKGAIVEHNIMRDCPRLLPEGEAAAGIWPWSSDDTVIQYNEVSDHKAPWDAQGFDSDWNCQGTIIQYNYSHENEGGFCLICTKGNSNGPQNIGNIGTIIRYNISINDGLRTKPTRAKGMFNPTFHISGPCKNTHIYNNTIYINKKPAGNIDRTLVRMDNWGGPWPINTTFTNNIFYTEDSTCYFMGKAVNTLFQNNLYWGTHKESPEDSHAIRKNPLFASVGQTQSEISPLSLHLTKESPCINAGTEIKNSGGLDFTKNSIPSRPNPTLGAIEYREPTNKTMVAWVAPANLTHRGGSALTIQSGDQFDGIVFGEIQPGKWMAGSNFYNRTEKLQDKYPSETMNKTMVQMAIVYEGDRIRIYRNGERYASYQTKNIDLLSPENNIAVFGLRHIGAASGHFVGAIEDARIYSKALTVDDIKSLRPNKASKIKPYAWWDFEGDTVKDRTGRFAHSQMKHGAKLMNGKLVLSENSVLVTARTQEALKTATRDRGASAPTPPYVEETPAMPKEVPANWLTYHLAHPGPGVGMPGDPNPAFFYKGRYHLHYIYKNKHGFAFAHVSSKDMVTWTWHPTVLVGHNTGHGMFSGTGFFTREGQPAMIYHGQGANNNYLAFALDDNLDQWTKPRVVTPKTQSGQVAEIRMWDPDCWLNNDTYYAISGGGPPHLMKSSNLKDWQYLGLLLHDNMPDLGVSKNEDISCANMFKIGDKWMLLCISHGIGCRYYLGQFRDEKYLPEFHAMMNWKDWHFFAPESLLTPDGRRVMWAWCRLAGAQSAIQSLPRELSLPEDGVLRIKPLRELETLRDDALNEDDITVKSESHHRLKTISGDTLELNVKIRPTTAKAYGVSVFCGKDGKGFPITINPERKVLEMGDIKPPFELKPGEPLTLRLFLDKNMVEVFVNDRQAAVYMQPHDKENVGISLFSQSGEIKARVQGWRIKSIYGEP